MNNILEIESMQLGFGYKTVLSDIYIKCETGNITGLLGRNGAGKSSLFKVAFGTMRAQSKSVRINNAPMRERGALSYLPQFNFIPQRLSIEKVFRDFDVDIDRFTDYFPGFTEKGTCLMNSLSGGEVRLIEVYVIIMCNTMFSFLDEPFTHIAPVEVEKIKEILMIQKLRKGFIVSDHKYQEVMDICDELYLLSEGATRLIHDLSQLVKFNYLQNKL